MLGPLVRVPAAHRRDPLPFGHGLSPRGQRVLNVTDGRRVLEDGVVAGTVGEAHAVHVRFDEPGNRCAPFEIDDLRVRSGSRRTATDGDETAVSDRHGAGDRVAGVHRVDAPVGQDEGLIRRHSGAGAGHPRRLRRHDARGRFGADDNGCRGRGAQKLPARDATFHLTHFVLHQT